MTRTTVYVAREAFVGAGGSVRDKQVVLESYPAVARHPTMWREAGTVDEETAAYIDLLGEEATLPRLFDRIRPAGIEAPPEPVDLSPIPRRGPGRPGWTKTLFRARWREAITRGSVAEPVTYRAIAPTFEMLDGTIGADPIYLGKLAREHGTE
jgi:hypothetical protein